MLSDVKILGYAEHVEEQALDEETYTFIEGVQNPFSCTVLVKGAHKHVLEQIKDAVRDGLRAVSNAMTDGFLVQGAGTPTPTPSPAPTPTLNLQAENELLRQQNITIASETRQFLDDHRPAKGE